jgi:DnaJ like chaperone protein
VLGKLFGGAFGFMVGGPLGALLGAAVGHNFDQGGSKKTAEPDPAGIRDQARSVFNATAFQLMGYLAKADGRVSEREIAAARAVMDHLRLNAGQRRSAIDCFTEGKQPDFAVDAALDTFRNACRGQPALPHRLLELLLNVAYADGDPQPQTHARLVHIAERLGIVRLQFEALHTLFRAQRWTQQQSRGHSSGSGQGGQNERGAYSRRPATAVNSLGQAYAVLGVNRDASPDEIKLAYRRLIGRHHPDKLAAKGVSPAELARATEKTRELTAAYERIREARGL